MKSKRPVRHCAADYVFLSADTLLMSLFLLVLAYPMLYILFASFSGSQMTLSLNILPESWSIEGYRAVFEYRYIWSGYGNSLLYMILGTVVSLIVTVCCAYPLSRKDFKGRGLMMGLCVFTMYFNGGLIPSYLLVRDLGMLDTVWAIVLPGALSVYNMIVMRTYFKATIPDELLEAAQLDGCGDLRYLLQIVLPLSGPILAVVALYVAVDLWNGYFSALVYLQSRSKMPLAIVLRDILVLNNIDPSQMGSADAQQLMNLQKRQQVMKYAVICVASIPMLCLYPFVQKYFVKGVMIGAVKG